MEIKQKKNGMFPLYPLLALTICMLSCSPKKEAPEDTARTVLELEQAALDYWSAGDPVGYASNFADDATYMDDIAASVCLDSIDEVSRYFKSLEGQIPKHLYDLMDPKVQVYGDVAIVSLRYQGKTEEGELSTPWKATSVYHKVNGQWKVVHAHWSVVK